MEKLKTPKIQGALRHLLTALGPIIAILMAVDDPFALLSSLVRPENWPAIVGLLMAALGFWSSWSAPEKQH
ncbi:MAG: hypothetical protein EpisKO_41720 [Epibacterium sp.]